MALTPSMSAGSSVANSGYSLAGQFLFQLQGVEHIPAGPILGELPGCFSGPFPFSGIGGRSFSCGI